MSEQEQKIDETLTRGVAEVIEGEHLKKRLLGGEKLRVKFGIDPTSPSIHLGRAVSLLKLRDFQELGCEIVFIVGDFTGTIGDTSDKESERPMLDAETVQRNMETYTIQAAKILDFAGVEVRFNAEWLARLDYKEILGQAEAFSLHDFISRENIKKRLDSGKRVSLRELLYPLMQGHDSVVVKSDVEIGGSDQWFNLLAGRKLQERAGQAPQDILTTDLILGTDGRKMSSSWGNTINILDEPNDMFGKVMSLPDTLLESYFIHCTRIPMERVKEFLKADNPRDAKLRLAHEIVSLYHGAKEAADAEAYFIDNFSKGKIPNDIPELAVGYEGDTRKFESLESFIVRIGFAASKSDARRKIEQGGVSLDGEKVAAEGFIFDKEAHDGKVLKVGKKDFARIVF